MTDPSAKPLTVLIVACEQSGDNYGGLLAEQLKQQAAAAGYALTLSGLGGKRMDAAGVKLIANTLEHAATGASEIIGELKFYFGAMHDLEDAARSAVARGEACVAVLIDSPEFNLRAAPRMKAAGAKVAYYVSPQMWAWRSGRVKTVQMYVDEMMVIFPFEQAWYAERGAAATFVGHPMLDLFDLAAIRQSGAGLRRELGVPAFELEKPRLIGLLPGSRRNEVTRLMPRFLEAGLLALADGRAGERVLARVRGSGSHRPSCADARTDGCERLPLRGIRDGVP
jgi:lipid-A-disaccharide synthase